MTGKLKVLVFDDTEIHRKSALLLLSGDYDLTVVGTYDEAQKALVPVTDYKKAKKLLPDLLEIAGLKRDLDPLWASKDDQVKYKALQDKSYKFATTYPDFDIVLTDLLVPASQQAMGEDGLKFVGQEMPLGTTIALLALCSGVKKVAVVTDINHHDHPGSAAFDRFPGCKAEGIKIICTNSVGLINIDEATGKLVEKAFLDTDEGRAKYPYPEGKDYGPRKGLSYGKDWKDVLLQLTGELKKE